jgi:hypothetical protein
MYTGRVGRNDVTPEWIRKTDAFVERTYGEAAKRASQSHARVANLPNGKENQRRTWYNIFRKIDLHWTILGGSSMVKRIVRRGGGETTHRGL